jgi:hypothetical protein
MKYRRTKEEGGSLTPRIIELYLSGMGKFEISQKLGCSHTNVIVALRRNANKLHGVAINGLPSDQMKWLVSEAVKSGVAVEIMARALLLDAIHEAMDGKPE